MTSNNLKYIHYWKSYYHYSDINTDELSYNKSIDRIIHKK